MEVSEDGEHLEGGNESDDIQAQMRAIMGFKDFGTTKQKKVPGNNIYGVRKDKKTEYRQYMHVSPSVLNVCGLCWLTEF